MSYTILLNSGEQIYCHKYRTLEHGIGYQREEGQYHECYISAQKVSAIYPETQQERELWDKFGKWYNEMIPQISRDGNCEYDRMMHKIREIFKSNIPRSEMIMQLTAIRVKYESEQIEAIPAEINRVKAENSRLQAMLKQLNKEDELKEMYKRQRRSVLGLVFCAFGLAIINLIEIVIKWYHR